MAIGNLYGVVVFKNPNPSALVSRGMLLEQESKVVFFDSNSLKHAEAYQKKMSQDNPGYNVYLMRGTSVAKSAATTTMVQITDKDEILPME
jgi:hypothetical protein